MGKGIPIQLTKIKQIVAEIREFPAKIDSTELAKNARHLLKKYAVLSEKIERNALITLAHQKDLAKIRTEEFKGIRRTLKEKANSMLHEKQNKKVSSVKPVKKTSEKSASKKTVEKSTSKKTAKVVEAAVVKEKDTKKPVKKSSPKPRKASAPKADSAK